MAELTIHTEDLGGSPLFRTLRSGTRSPEWVPALPHDAVEWAERARSIAGEFPDGEWLSVLSEAFSANGPARERLERVAVGGGVLVTTGQQPGLFGGPLLTLAKALSARALADVIELETGIPTAPVFWAATDDADFEEAAHVWMMTNDGAADLALRQAPPVGTPMAAAPLVNDDLVRLLPALGEAAGSAPDPRPIELTRQSYVAGSTVGTAYVTLLRELLGPLGIAVLDASHRSVLRAGRPLLRRALHRSREVAAALHARNASLREAGFAPQVDEVAGLSLVFANDGKGKLRVPVTPSGDVDDRADDDDHDGVVLSPTVLLRPTMERAILPTVAYVGGPAEGAYFAQASAAASALDAAIPLAVPRWSMTIIEPRVARILARLGVDAHELRESDRLASRLAKARLPEGIASALEELRRALDPALDQLRRADVGGLVSARSVEGTALGIAGRLARLDRRYTAAMKRREAELMRDIRVASASLYPGGVRQERRHAYVPFLARYGPMLIDRMLEGATAHARTLVAPAAPPAPAAVTLAAGVTSS